MKASEAKSLFMELASDYFSGYTVIWANQSRVAKPSIPLVVLQSGAVKRPQAANSIIGDDGTMTGYYLSRMTITADLFTNGSAVTDDSGNVAAYDNTAMDEMLAFADYLNSPVAVQWGYKNNVSVLIESDAQDLTGAVNDSNYEYRSRLEILLYFTQETEAYDLGYFETAEVEGES